MPGRESVDVKKIRAAVAKAAEDNKSVRRVAEQIGLSYTAVRWFIAGGKPQIESLRRLVGWYVSHRSAGNRPTGAELAIATKLLVARVNQAVTPALKKKRARELVRAILRELDDEAQRIFREMLRDS